MEITKLEITLQGGKITPIDIPEGTELNVNDFDTEGREPTELWVDTDTGEWYRHVQITCQGARTIVPPLYKSAAAAIAQEITEQTPAHA